MGFHPAGAAVLVLALALAIILVLYPAENAGAGTVVGSLHDLSAQMKLPDMRFWDAYADYNEVCVYCHTPHAASADAPLWNRPSPTSNYTLYSNPATGVAAGAPGKASVVCLSCHDGTIAVDTILNMPGSGTQFSWHNPAYPDYESYHSKMKMPDASDQTMVDSCGSCHGPSPIGGKDASQTFLTTNLSDEHPVGIAYPDIGDFAAKPTTGKFANGVQIYEGKVECLSCHDPHNPSNGPFLRVANERSAICYTCHVK